MNARTALLCCALALCLAPLAGAEEAAPLPSAAAAPSVTAACPADPAVAAEAAWLGGPAAAPLARAACSATFCSDRRAECLSGCPCAIFECKPANCSYICSCPIICLEES